jgi:hypothetical protein
MQATGNSFGCCCVPVYSTKHIYNIILVEINFRKVPTISLVNDRSLLVDIDIVI